MSKLIPLSDYVVATQSKPKTVTASGILLPEKSKKKQLTADVLSVGGDVKGVAAGDKIVFKSHSTYDVTIGDDEFIVIKEEDILAVVKGDE